MRLFRLRRFAVAFWLGLLALTASGVAQNQLSTNVLVAALTDISGHDHHHGAIGHIMPDGSFMPGAMPGMEHTDPAHSGGHSHKGHSDCTMCSAVAAMAGLSAVVIDGIISPQTNVVSPGWASIQSCAVASSPAFYSSRAPPLLIG